MCETSNSIELLWQAGWTLEHGNSLVSEQIDEPGSGHAREGCSV